MSNVGRLPLVLSLALAACGGNVAPGGAPADGGHEDGSLGDATSEGGSPDGGCVAAVQGSACTATEVACMPAGDACCIGYIWSCVSGAWDKQGLGCPCAVDAAVDVAHVDANPAACPANWMAATTGDHADLCASSTACGYAEGTCDCQPFCGGIPVPDASLSSQWRCTPRRTDGCSDTAPKDGDPCSVSGQACTYSPCCVTTYTCTGGHWKAGPMACPG
jgi:hypothetical protein